MDFPSYFLNFTPLLLEKKISRLYRKKEIEIFISRVIDVESAYFPANSLQKLFKMFIHRPFKVYFRCFSDRLFNSWILHQTNLQFFVKENLFCLWHCRFLALQHKLANNFLTANASLSFSFHLFKYLINKHYALKVTKALPNWSWPTQKMGKQGSSRKRFCFL